MKLCTGSLIDAKLLSGRPNDLKPVAGGVTVTQSAAGDPVSIALDNGGPLRKKQALPHRVHLVHNQRRSGQHGHRLRQLRDHRREHRRRGRRRPGLVATDRAVEVRRLGRGHPVQRDRLEHKRFRGTFIASLPDQKVIIKETLGANHEVCEGGLVPTVWRANRLPGLNGETTNHVQRHLRVRHRRFRCHGECPILQHDHHAEGKDQQDSTQYYYVKFRSCVIEKEVPDSSDVFTNTAVVNGISKDASVTGPKFEGGKTGTRSTPNRRTSRREAACRHDHRLEGTGLGHTLEGLDARRHHRHVLRQLGGM